MPPKASQPLRVAYLTGRYPEISHTFVMREIHALRRLGVDVRTFSIWRTDPARLLAASDREEAARTYSLLPARWGDIVAAHAHALAARRAGAWRTLMRALRLSRPGVRGRLMGALWFVEAVVLWHRCVREGVRHVHVHLNGTAPAVAFLAAQLGNGGRARRDWTWSLTVHGPAEFYDVPGERLADKVRDADLVVAISDFARSQVMAQVEEDCWEKIAVIHCGLESAVFAPAPRTESPPGAMHVLNVSRLAPSKGNAVLLHALAELVRRDVRVTAMVIGDGPDRQRLERLATRLELGDRVRFTGAVGQHEIRDHYERADAFCLPSFAEGVPVVLMEAMAMELPVVATRVMGVSELVDDGVSGLLVAPGRVDALADALELLANAPERRRAMGRMGREKVIAEFDVDRSARQLREAFERVSLGRGAPGAPVAVEVRPLAETAA